MENKYKPIPFWSWNEKLEIDETVEQIQKMDEAGLGGFFMHWINKENPGLFVSVR